MKVDVAPEEFPILVRWKKRSDSLTLVRMKAEAVLYASEGVSSTVIAKMVERSERTIREWLADWRLYRMKSVVTGHAGNENAAKLTSDEKEKIKEALSKPPAESGIKAEFWDVPAVKNLVKTWFDVEYKSESSYHLLLKFCGMSFKLPDPFDKRRDEEAITERMEQVKEQVSGLLDEGWEVYTIDEVRVEHEAETRRMWLPKGQRTRLYVDRVKASQSFFGALSLTNKKMKIYPLEGNQNAEQIIFAMERLQRETSNDKIALVLDNAGFHHAKALTSLFEPGQVLDHITPIFLPPYAPEHNPTEHVWNAAKGHIANLQRETSHETFSAFSSYVSGRTFDYDFENLPI